jgi:hypothetical protein
MPEFEGSPPQTSPVRAKPRFGIGGLLLLTIVFAVMGAAARQFVLAVQRGSSPRAGFVIFTLAAPAIVVAVMGAVYQLTAWLGRCLR